ncbi:MAG: aminopeptidase P family protein [Burkholderiales bacterium]|nr:aminopeptidase P family protein [Phycisphaerae bacterium]
MSRVLVTIRAGVPTHNLALYHRIRFTCHDPAVFIELDDGTRKRSILIIRNVELNRARQLVKSDKIYCPKDFTPPGGLSGDREIATAQAAIECLRRHAVTRACGDRSLPLLYVSLARESGIEIELDADLGVRERRQKDEQEIGYLRQAQRDTESAIRMACELIASASARADGVLMHEGQPLDSRIVRVLIDTHLMKLGYINDQSIVACGPIGADCHNPGEGLLRTGQPVIVDVFPMNKQTLYHGDCTRMVVHGDVPEVVNRMLAMVSEAKKAAETATRAGATGDAIHHATVAVLKRHGVHIGFAPPDAAKDLIFIPHGTGHGIGLDLKEPPLLDFNGPELLVGDAVTIEPAVYSHAVGGVRLEDLYIVREAGAENLGGLPEGLSWK